MEEGALLQINNFLCTDSKIVIFQENDLSTAYMLFRLLNAKLSLAVTSPILTRVIAYNSKLFAQLLYSDHSFLPSTDCGSS